jgi:phosphatidylglycerol:prolipoprotein diacylglycerol transferase
LPGRDDTAREDALVILPVIAYPMINQVALQAGPFTVRWYGLAYLAGFVIAGLILHAIAKRWGLGLTGDDELTIVLGAVVGVVVGGRLGYVLVYGNGYFWTHPAEIFAIWEGGMSFHGGLLGIIIAAYVVGRSLKIPFLTLCDLGAVGAPIGLFLGRIANFINHELWGRVTNVPWAMVFPGAGPLPRHPSQLYEAFLEGIVLFIVLLTIALRRPAPRRGVIFGWLLTLYGVFRIFVEFFRQPDIQMGQHGFFAGWLTTGMILSAPLVVIGIGVIVWASRRRLPELGPAEQPEDQDDPGSSHT